MGQSKSTRKSSTSKVKARGNGGKCLPQPASGIPGGFAGLYEKLLRDHNIDVHLDEAHDISTVYAYCGFDAYRDILEAVFGDGNSEGCHEAAGQTSRGRWKKNEFVTVIVVWINDIRPKDETMSTMVHEMSHMADFVVQSCGIEDSSGEVKAYIMESEARRVFRTMYGVNEKQMLTVEELVSELSKVECGDDALADAEHEISSRRKRK